MNCFISILHMFTLLQNTLGQVGLNCVDKLKHSSLEAGSQTVGICFINTNFGERKIDNLTRFFTQIRTASCLFVCLFVMARQGRSGDLGVGPTWTIHGLGDPFYFGASPPADITDLESLWGPCPTN